jgi:hypothetical protein
VREIERGKVGEREGWRERKKKRSERGERDKEREKKEGENKRKRHSEKEKWRVGMKAGDTATETGTLI